MSEDLLRRDFHADMPLSKCITDVTEIKACDGKLYISALFDFFDSGVLGLSMDTNKKASLCVKMLANAMLSYPKLKGGNSAFRSRQPVYESGVSKSCSRLRDSVKHEQCRWSLS